MIGLHIVITVRCLDNHGVDLDPFSKVCGAIILLDRARLELQGPNNSPKVWSERTIIGYRNSRISVVVLSLIGIECSSGILISLIRI